MTLYSFAPMQGRWARANVSPSFQAMLRFVAILTRITQEGFYCNRRYACATNLPSAASPLGRSTYGVKHAFFPSWAQLWSLPSPLLQGG